MNQSFAQTSENAAEPDTAQRYLLFVARVGASLRHIREAEQQAT